MASVSKSVGMRHLLMKLKQFNINTAKPASVGLCTFNRYHKGETKDINISKYRLIAKEPVRCFIPHQCTFSTSIKQNSLPTDLDVGKARSLIIRTGNKTDLDIKCISLIKSPDQNKADFSSSNSENITVKESGRELHLISDGESSEESSCNTTAEVPIYFDIDLIVGGKRNVSVSKFENSKVMIATEEGDCKLHHMQTSGTSRIETQGGCIESTKLLQGNILITTLNKGHVKTERVQGHTIEVSTEAGDIDLGAIYADTSLIRTERGNISIKACHRNTEVSVSERGDVNLASVSGNLEAHIARGNTSVVLAEPGQVNITTNNGDVTVKMLDSVKLLVDLQGGQIQMDESLTLQESDTEMHANSPKAEILGVVRPSSQSVDNEEEITSKLVVKAPNGRINLEYIDWITSLGIMAK